MLSHQKPLKYGESDKNNFKKSKAMNGGNDSLEKKDWQKPSLLKALPRQQLLPDTSRS